MSTQPCCRTLLAALTLTSCVAAYASYSTQAENATLTPNALAATHPSSHPPAPVEVSRGCNSGPNLLRGSRPQVSDTSFMAPGPAAPCQYSHAALAWSPTARLVELLKAATEGIPWVTPEPDARHWSMRMARDEFLLSRMSQTFDRMLSEFALNGLSLWNQGDRWTDRTMTVPRLRFARYRLDDGTDLIMTLQANDHEMAVTLTRIATGRPAPASR